MKYVRDNKSNAIINTDSKQRERIQNERVKARKLARLEERVSELEKTIEELKKTIHGNKV